MLLVDLKQIEALYESILMQESPGTVLIGDRYYSAEDKTLGNYTGILNVNGKFVMSRDTIGHEDLLRRLYNDLHVTFENIITNFNNKDELLSSGILYNPVKFRIWPKFKIFSTWDEYKPQFKDAIDAAISAAGSNSIEYIFDPPGGYGEKNYKTYDEYMKVDLTDEEKKAAKEAERRKQSDVLALGKYMAGMSKKPIDYSMEPKQRPTFYSRSGD